MRPVHAALILALVVVMAPFPGQTQPGLVQTTTAPGPGQPAGQPDVKPVDPPHAQYHLLRAALVRYRQLKDAPAYAVPLGGSAALRPGDRHEDLRSLAAKLAGFGDLDPADADVGAIYEGAIVDAVRRFQRRHGLADDGVIGRATRSALDTPLARRIGQLELALERWRAMPAFKDTGVVLVNAATFRLWAWNEGDPGPWRPLSMKVIVGQANRTETPELAGTLETIELAPYWNVPGSIARNEVLPKAARDPDYLRREGIDVVQGAGDDAVAVAMTAENLANVRTGLLRLRQRPGPRNAMGLVKFVFPNPFGVFMHGTSAPGLFDRPRRDFSHGCVRVEDPFALAAWALADPADWSIDRIREVAGLLRPRRVPAGRAITVVLFYATASVEPADGTVHFAEDIYARDRALQSALDEPTLDRLARFLIPSFGTSGAGCAGP